jgi:hypothetical protein
MLKVGTVPIIAENTLPKTNIFLTTRNHAPYHENISPKHKYFCENQYFAHYPLPVT